MTSSDDIQARAASLRREATRRWLVKDELMFLLLHYKSISVQLLHSLLLRPPSGTLVFYNTLDVPDYKKDGWLWQKRKDKTGRVREDRAKLVINRQVIILGAYVHSAENRTFHRRIYSVRDSIENIVLVHYFDEVYNEEIGRQLCSDANKVEKEMKRSLPDAADSISSKQQPSLNAKATVESIIGNCYDLDFEPQKTIYQNPSIQFSERDMVLVKDNRLSSVLGVDDQLNGLDCAFFPGMNTYSFGRQPTFELTEISDFSPDWDGEDGGAKILICLATKLPESIYDDPMTLFVQFGANRVCAEKVSATVLRCTAPSSRDLGTVEIYVCYWSCVPHQGSIQLSHKRKFTYRSRYQVSPSLVGDVADQSRAPSEAEVDDPLQLTTYKRSTFCTGKRGRSPAVLPHATTGSKRTKERLYDTNRNLSTYVESALDERQCKIRVVERLSEFHQAICTTSAECVVSGDKSDTFAGSNGGEKKIHLGIDHNPQGLPDVHSSLDSSLIHVRHQCLEPSCSTLPDGKLTPQLPSYESSTFLDDCTIEVLSDNELEQLSEKLLEVVVHQLVTVAHTSKELLEELNSLDETGLSLLHYVSFYNYFQLVPVLVAHGAHINQQSTQGQTALHLAAGCGHSEVVDVLQQSGADLQVRDFDGLTAADRADKSGHLDVAAHLYRLMADHRNCELAIDDNMYECGQVPMEIDDAWTPYIDAGDMGLLDLESDANELPWIRSPRSHSNSCGSEASVSSKVTSYVGENHKHNRKLLLGAFSTMSLRDKCALSLSISAGQRRDSSIGEELPLSPCTSSSTSTGFSSSPASIVGVDAKLIGGRFVLAGTENDSDVHSVIAEDEESLNKLQAAMELMGPEEKQSLEDEVKVLQHGVRAWLLRRNCKNMRETTKQLREATLSMKQEKSTEYSSNEQSERERAAVTVQAATRSMLARRSFLQTKHVAIKFQAATRGVLCRKKFARMKAQALSSLVIQRNVREWWNNQPDTSQDAHTDTFRPASVNCSTHN